MFSDKPVSTDKADVNFFIYLVDGIVDRPSSRICLYKLGDVFHIKDRWIIDREGISTMLRIRED